MCVPTDKVGAGEGLAAFGSAATKHSPQKPGKRLIRRLLQRCVLRGTLALLCAGAMAGALAPEMRAQSESGTSGGIGVVESEQIFATLCALDAAGFAADESTLGDMPERLSLRADLLNMHGPATEAVRSYYRDHPEASPDDLLSRYITFALVIGPPPDFSFQVGEDEMPPEALDLEEFQPLLAAFYKEANLGARWQKIEPEYETLAGSYRPLVRGIVVKTNAYLRQAIGAENGRTFTVYVEPLAGNRTNFRDLGDHYSLVVGSKPADAADEIQHAYIHFMLDPLVLKDRNKLQTMMPLLDIAARAPQLAEEYRTDLVEFVDECVVKAVELRLRNLPAAEQEAVLKQDDASGFVMVRPLVAGLKNFEADNPSMNYYLAEWIAGVDVPTEQKRLQGVAFATDQPVTPQAGREHAASESKDDLLAQGDREIALRDVTAATDTFNKVLATAPNDPHALYGLAVASVLSGRAEESKQLFQKAVASSGATGPGGAAQTPDPTVLAWSHIYLGRIDDLEGTRDQAIREYQAALAVIGVPESARVAAQNGVNQAYAPAKRPDAQQSSQ